MKKYLKQTGVILALLAILAFSQAGGFAQRGGHGGGGHGGGHHGGMSRGGGGHHGGMSGGSFSRGSSHFGGSSRSVPSRSHSFSQNRSSTSRQSTPSRSMNSSANRSSRSSTRPGQSYDFSRGIYSGSSRHSGSITSRQGSGNSNPGLSSRGRNQGSFGYSHFNSGSHNRGNNPGLRPGSSRLNSGLNSSRTYQGFANHRSGNPGLRSGGGRQGNHHVSHSPGLRPGGINRNGGNFARHGNNSYYYKPGYWSGYRSRYALGFGFGSGYGYGYGYYPYYHYRRYGYSPWLWSTFGGLTAWVGYNNLYPVGYNYSLNNGYIYNNGVQVAPVTAYQSQADQIIDSVSPPDDAADWMPVGIFAIVPQGTTEVNVTVQLAVGKNGAVAGTYFNKDGNITLPLQGAIDESKQRVAWKIGEEDPITMETGLDSLTKDKSTVIIYFTGGTSEVWDMLRIDEQTAKLAQQELQVDDLKYELLASFQELEQILDDAWKDYLALPVNFSATGPNPSLAELEPIVQNYQQIQVDSKYQVITNRQEFQNTYHLLTDYVKSLKEQQTLAVQKKLPAPPQLSPTESTPPVLVAPKPLAPVQAVE
ncbi:MAG: hypothetical protein KDA70_00310 [Planctomycetaceae bacterium]|nr:hypothetical protein [Planctomycetaceae bacterium]